MWPEQLLGRTAAAGQDALLAIARRAVERLLGHGGTHALAIAHLFSADEMTDLVAVLAAVRGTAAALGMALVRDRWERLVKRRARPLREDVTRPSDGLSTPEAALEYFRSLVPTLGTDPQRFGDDQRRTAFTLAAATDTELLGRVQDVIRRAIETGESVRSGAESVRQVLDAAGVSVANDGYATMVFRTNVMDAHVQASWEEMQSPEVRDYFPVWKYSAIVDGRARPTHAARDGNYYPRDVPFATVRGLAISDVANCRCVPVAIDRFDWETLRKNGARVADGYPDVPA